MLERYVQLGPNGQELPPQAPDWIVELAGEAAAEALERKRESVNAKRWHVARAAAQLALLEEHYFDLLAEEAYGNSPENKAVRRAARLRLPERIRGSLRPKHRLRYLREVLRIVLDEDRHQAVLEADRLRRLKAEVCAPFDPRRALRAY